MSITTTCTILTLAAAACTALGQSAIPAEHRREAVPRGDSLIWSHFAGDAKRGGGAHALHGMPVLGAPAWVADEHIPVPQTGLVVDGEHVYAIATDPDEPGTTFAAAWDREMGGLAWATPVPGVVLDSWSTPAIDVEHGRLIVATGSGLTAIRCVSGDVEWSTDIGGIVVNASPAVTGDLGGADRVFITTYSFGGGSAKLFCINIDPWDAAGNPFEPGEIVWEVPLGGDSSGNTPAYVGGVVYVATASGGAGQRGRVMAFDAESQTAPSPAWSFTNTANAGFFGGVTVARGHVYAASYTFSGLQHSANTVKLDKQTGELVWSVPTNRTDATPIVLDSGDVVLSSGLPTGAFDFLPFYGSLPSVQYIEDLGESASVRWDSALETHDDSNDNGIWDFGEPFLSIGGWTHQPIVLETDGGPMLLVGTLAESRPGVNTDHSTDLRLVDLSRGPGEAGFVVGHFDGAGSTPAYSRGWVYTAGTDGIHAFGPTPPLLRVRALVDQYTDGEISLQHLMEGLAR